MMRRSNIGTGDSKITPSSEGDSNNSHSKFLKSFHKFAKRGDKKKSKSSSFHKMLTSCQLSDLFRRLDKNGNGELELSEFLLIIKKLKFPVEEEYVNRVFREVDAQKSGFLSMEEFITGYQILYTRTCKIPESPVGSSTGMDSVPHEIVYAIRYGLDELKNHVFEVYAGSLTSSAVLFTEKSTYLTNNFGRYRVHPLENFDLAKLNEAIVHDSERNLTRKTRIYWWVDVCMERMEPRRVDQYIANFGLPNDIKFRTMFSQFGIRLPRDSNGHMYAGNGASPCGPVSSLSFFYHALWISSVPVVHNLPTWLHKYLESLFSPLTYRLLRRYYDTRFAFMFSSLMGSPISQQRVAMEAAQTLGERLFEDEDYTPRPLPAFSLKPSMDDVDSGTDESGLAQPPGTTTHRDPSIFTPPELEEEELEQMRDDIPNWLQTGPDMKQTASRMNYETISFHILDAGYGACAVMTFREIEPESKQHLTSPTDIYSSGTLGRLLCSVRRKILENMSNEGVTALGGEVSDCPFSLVAMIVTLVSNFSMNTMGPLHAWKKLIEAEVDDVAVSKHVDHSSEMKRISDAIKIYVDQTTALFNKLFNEAAVDRSNESLLLTMSEAELSNQMETAEAKTKLFSQVWNAMRAAKKMSVSVSASRAQLQLEEAESPAVTRPGTATGSGPGTGMGPGAGTMPGIRRRVSTLPPGAEDLPIGFDLIQQFLGPSPCTHLKHILYGDEHLELKGLLYWSDRMNSFHESIELMAEKIQFALEEKRNFFSYLLSVVTIFLGPLTVLTGYWGMNFDNMHELDHAYYPLTPGVKLLWAIGYLIYGFILILAIHYRFLYSAT